MKQIEICDVAKETLDILSYFDSTFVSKIPVNFLNGLKDLAKKSNLIIKIDKDRTLKEQKISEECKSLIALIYYDYIATKEEKEEIEKIWNENELLYQKKLSVKYDPNNLFKKNDKKEISNLPSVIQKESNFQKIINFLKKIFTRNGR